MTASMMTRKAARCKLEIQQSARRRKKFAFKKNYTDSLHFHVASQASMEMLMESENSTPDSAASCSSSSSSTRGSCRVAERRAWATGIDQADISCHTLSVRY